MLQRTDDYRRVFARIAGVAALLSIFVGTAIFMNDEGTRFLDRPVRPREFALAWLAVFVATMAVSGLLLRRARNVTEAFPSIRLQIVFGHAVPFVIIPAAFTGWFFATGYLGGTELELVVVWIAFYGLLLVSVNWFAPRGIVLLGWAFLLTALAVPVVQDPLDIWIGSVPTVLMAGTFGLYHLFYAVLNWRGRTDTAAGSPSAGS